jgi:hypothetical protein
MYNIKYQHNWQFHEQSHGTTCGDAGPCRNSRDCRFKDLGFDHASPKLLMMRFRTTTLLQPHPHLHLHIPSIRNNLISIIHTQDVDYR